VSSNERVKRLVPCTVLHIPHSATTVPPDLRVQLLLSDEALARELLVMTDWYTDELFTVPETDAVPVRFPVSRLIVDPERFLDDSQEPMASRGMGVIYTRASDGLPLRAPPTASARAALIARYYEPHHRELSGAVERALGSHACALVIDCHGFPSHPLPCDSDQRPDRPDVCLGTDEFHTPPWLCDLARRLFEAAGFVVAVDRPYRGALVPSEHYRRTTAVRAIMVELNRRCYMDESSGARLAAFHGIADRIRETLVGLIRAARPRLAPAGRREGSG
jgi:N-formylglutamate deformylase